MPPLTFAQKLTQHASRPMHCSTARLWQSGVCVLAACALGPIGLPALFPQAQGQNYVSPGSNGLDANLQVGSGGVNTRVQSGQINTQLNNDIVTGNVTGGRGLQVDVGYRAAGAFMGELGSDDLFSNRAYSTGSGLNTASYYSATSNPTGAIRNAYQNSYQSGNSNFYVGDYQVTPDSSSFAPSNYNNFIADSFSSSASVVARQSYTSTAGKSYTVQASPLLGVSRIDVTANTLQQNRTNTALTQYAAQFKVDDAPDNTINRYIQSQDPLNSQPIEAQNPLANQQVSLNTLNEQRVTLTLGQRLIDATTSPSAAQGNQTPQATSAPRNTAPGTTSQGNTFGQSDFGQDPSTAPQNPTKPGSNTPSNNQGNTPETNSPSDSTFNPQDGLRQLLFGEDGDAGLEKIQGDTAYKQLLENLLDNKPVTNNAPRVWNNPSQLDEPSQDRLARLEQALEDRQAGRLPGEANTQTKLRQLQQADPELASLLQGLNYDMPALSSLAGDEDSRVAEFLATAETAMSENRFFDADRQYQQVLLLRPSDPMARIGRVHALLGAGMIRSAALQLRGLFEMHPELIATTYQTPLLPSDEQIRKVQKDLMRLAEAPDTASSAGIMIAYVGYQKSSRTLIRYGLAVAETASSQDPLLPVLRQIWFEEPQNKR